MMIVKKNSWHCRLVALNVGFKFFGRFKMPETTLGYVTAVISTLALLIAITLAFFLFSGFVGLSLLAIIYALFDIEPNGPFWPCISIVLGWYGGFWYFFKPKMARIHKRICPSFKIGQGKVEYE